ncbi:MAG: serpin family protein [Anaerolineales bacterium]|nr:serpin family protein [Anaerolineales bacterium]
MKNQNSFRKLMLLIIITSLVLILTACSGAESVFQGGSRSQIQVSDLPRVELDDYPAESLAQLAAGNTSFALDLYQYINSREGNLFYSPYSISSALAMTYAGAEGKTAQEMESVFHFLMEEDKLHPAFNALDQHLVSLANMDIPEDQGDPFQLNIANAIWGQKDFHFEADFLDILAANYGAGLRLLDYVEEPEESRQNINQWVSDQTQEKIQDLIPQGAINSDTRMVLSNAIYFKATWLEQFEVIFTDAGIFTGLNGEQMPVTMMQHGSDPRFQYYQGDGFQAVDLPYVGNQVSMLVLVPDQGRFLDFEDGFTSQTLDHILEELAYTPVAITFPKFEFESEISLANILAEMGMPSAFNAEADYSGMTGSKELFISDVFHKAYIKVDEEGTEAAAATAVLMELTSAPENPIQLTVDRPFLFLIRDHETNSILFLGRVVSP